MCPQLKVLWNGPEHSLVHKPRHIHNSDAHECTGNPCCIPNPNEQKQMDLHNNQVGLQFILDHVIHLVQPHLIYLERYRQ